LVLSKKRKRRRKISYRIAKKRKIPSHTRKQEKKIEILQKQLIDKRYIRMATNQGKRERAKRSQEDAKGKKIDESLERRALATNDTTREHLGKSKSDDGRTPH